MGNKKTHRFWSAWGVKWTADQNMTDAKSTWHWQSAPEDHVVYMKAGRLVRASFGNDRVRNEPWMIKCFRVAHVQDVAE